MRKALLVIATSLALAHIPASSAETSKNELCKFIADHNGSAVLLAANGERIVEGIELGEFDFSDKSKWGDFIPSTKKFRMIVKPKSIILEESCSLSQCIDLKEVTPTCPNSREYMVGFQINPRKFGPGKFNSEIEFSLFNKKDQYPVDERFKYHFETRITGNFRMSSAEIIQRQATSESVIKLMKGENKRVKLELANRGNSQLNLGKWASDEDGSGPLTLDASECQNISLPSGGTCNLFLQNTSKIPVTEKYVSWHNLYYKEVPNISLYLTPRHDGSIDYNIKND